MKIKTIQQQLASLKLRHRPSQLEMIEQVHQSIKNNTIHCVEAPTGTGKTLSYLLASFHAKKKKQKVIISTATIALQEQLIKKDFPLLEKILGEKVRFATAKGRQNYLCLAKLYEENDEQNDFFSSNEAADYLQSQTKTKFWNGDKEELTDAVADKKWYPFTTDSNNCGGKRCDYYEDCYFYKARKKTHLVDFIVTNHSLLLSDIELGGGVLLPEPENNIYIIDECHHLPERSISHFSKDSLLLGSIEWINQLNAIVQRAIKNKFIETTWQQKVSQCTLALIAEIKQLKSTLDLNDSKFKQNLWRITKEDKPLFQVTESLLTHSQELNCFCLAINETLEKRLELEEKEEELIKQHSQFKFLLSRTANFFLTWDLFCKEQRPPIACWFEKTSDFNDYYCHCSPINVAEQLYSMLWKRTTNGVLLCSATLRSLGSFGNFLRKTGLKKIEKTNTTVMPAIFNYESSVIFVPSMKFEPSGVNQQAHRQEVLDLLPDLFLPNSGTLVLFTSRSAMHEALDQLPPSTTLDILMQGKQSKTKLVEHHKKRIDKGKRSILFGLASFAEGIDLPAEYCQHVIIHKLPFAVPTSPVELTRSEWISQHQLNPFLLSTLPETSIKLTQYVGRLIRQEDDIGIVTILDKRLFSKRYGKQLLENLPPFTKLIDTTVHELKKLSQVAKLYEKSQNNK